MRAVRRTFDAVVVVVVQLQKGEGDATILSIGS
jgi:hypothetical protein